MADERGGLATGTHAELAENAGHMKLDRVLGDTEIPRDRPIAMAENQLVEDYRR